MFSILKFLQRISTNKTASMVGILCLLVVFIQHWVIIAKNHPSTADVNENYLNNVTVPTTMFIPLKAQDVRAVNATVNLSLKCLMFN